ncbi:MAG: AgmX/PglI C-terminal domain-containing protein [Deltaproteobacteria bacterium]|nr:AgmX/PglI C-terminal domain-containing protein [Deltaproteobacteria bacterium]
MTPRHVFCLLPAMFLSWGCGGSSKKQVAPPRHRGPGEETTVRDESPVDDDDESGMQVEGLLGRIEMTDVQPVLEKRWSAIQSCYRNHVGELSYVGGIVDLRFRVGRDGAVTRAWVSQGDLGAWPVERCVLEIARRLTFPKPVGGEAEFSFPIEFPGHGSVVNLDEQRAEAELGEKLDNLSRCGAGAPSRVRVTVYIAPGGAVKSVGFSTDAEEPPSDAWAECAAKVALGWRLSDPRGRVWKAQGWYRP